MHLSLRLAALAAATTILHGTIQAQASHTVNGQWIGNFKMQGADVAIVLDLTKNQKGEWLGTFGMPEVGATGMRLDKLMVGQATVSFTVDAPGKPALDLKLSADGKTLSGTLGSGTTKAPVSLKRAGEAKITTETANSSISKAFEGVWQGSVDDGAASKFHLVLKLSRGANGAATGTLTNIDGSNAEIPITAIEQVGNYLKFEIRSTGGRYRGSLNAAGTEIKGEWTQTTSTPLTFTRGASTTSVNSALPKAFEGSWEGTLDGGVEAKIVLTIKLARAADGSATGTLSNKEANAKELPLSVIMIKDKTIQFEVGQLKAKYRATLSSTGTVMVGTWEQENALTAPLSFKRPASASKK
jgi:hypothetical protein